MLLLSLRTSHRFAPCPISPPPVCFLHPISPWVLAGTPDHKVPHLLDVERSDGLGEVERLGELHRDADFVRSYVGVGRDDGPARVVDALSHHVFPEYTLLSLEQLSDTRRGVPLPRLRVLGRVNVAIYL